MKIEHVTITLRRPLNDGDPGLCEGCNFILKDGVVFLCDENGTPLKRGTSTLTTRNTKGKDAPTWSAPVPDGHDPRQVAGRLLNSKFASAKSGHDFNRPLVYRDMGIA